MTAPYEPVRPVTPITTPLALRDSGDIDRFNEAAERNLAEMKAMGDDLNADFIPKVNSVAALVNASLDAINAAPDAAEAAGAAARSAALSEDGAAFSATTAQTAAAEAVAAKEAGESILGTLMDGATPEPTPGTPMRRDETGRTRVADPAGNQDAANKGYVDAAIASAPDGSYIIWDTDAEKIGLADGVRATLAKVDTAGSVSEAINDAVRSVPSGGFFTGMILPFYGSLNTAKKNPVVNGEELTDWQVCDGTNNTPDLRNRFVLGAGGSYASGATGGSTAATTSSAGSHAHNIGSTGATTLSGSTIPSHSHYMTKSGSTNISTSATFYAAATDSNGTQMASSTYGTSGSHSHTGGTIGSGGDHTHTVAVLPSYYALCYIMKL